MLLTECMTRIPAPRLVQLTNAENPGGLKDSPVSGTSLSVANGSTAVVGIGTSFLSFGSNIIIQFKSQPGVSYVVASIADNTHLTLLNAYQGITNAATTATLPQVNYPQLQQAVFDAQILFEERTNVVFDDVTANVGGGSTPLVLNKCIWAGVSLVVAFLYEYRAYPWPEAEVEAAWKIADRRLDMILHRDGDGAYATPASDSNYTPSPGATGAPPFDPSRLTDILSRPPGSSTGNTLTGTGEY